MVETINVRSFDDLVDILGGGVVGLRHEAQSWLKYDGLCVDGTPTNAGRGSSFIGCTDW